MDNLDITTQRKKKTEGVKVGRKEREEQKEQKLNVERGQERKKEGELDTK